MDSNSEIKLSASDVAITAAQLLDRNLAELDDAGQGYWYTLGVVEMTRELVLRCDSRA
jgi:hypothetical protein